MKNILKLHVILGLTAILLIPAIAISQSRQQNKTRHIRMMKIENGKRMNIDTVLTGDSPFIWNGDTINPEKHIRRFSPSEFDKIHGPGMDRRQKDGRYYRQWRGRNGDPFIMHGDSGKDFQMITPDEDSTSRKNIIHKRFRYGRGKNNMNSLPNGRRGFLPGVPNITAVPSVRMLRGMNSNNAIDLNDPNIISFDKKNIGRGREKIEIIRKKTSKTDMNNFDMNFDGFFQIPEPPMPPAIEDTTDQNANDTKLNEQSQEETKKADRKKQRKAARDNK